MQQAETSSLIPNPKPAPLHPSPHTQTCNVQPRSYLCPINRFTGIIKSHYYCYVTRILSGSNKLH